MLKVLLLIPTLVGITACGTIGAIYDRQDPCQTRPELGRPANYQPPSFCGSAASRTYIYAPSGARIGYVIK
jgi:hypothetical protein